MRVQFHIVHTVALGPVRRNAEAALQQPQHRRGVQRKRLHGAALAVGHTVDERKKQVPHDGFQNKERKIQDHIDDGHRSHLPHNAADQHREREKQQKAQHRRGKDLHRGHERRRAEACAHRP